MDGERFDAWTRALSGARTRRRFGAALAGAALAALLGRPDRAAAACRRDRQCRGGGVQKCCRGQCTNVAADRDNCGRCGHACPEDLVCRNKECRSPCPGDQALCGRGRKRKCVDLETDPRHCGRCGRECIPNQTCEQGRCRCSAVRCPDNPFDLQCCPNGSACCPRTSSGCCPREGVCTANGRACCPLATPKFCPAGSRGQGGCCAADADCCDGLCCPSTATCWPDGSCCPDGTRPCGDGTCCPEGRRCTRLGCVRARAARAAPGAELSPRVVAATAGAASL